MRTLDYEIPDDADPVRCPYCNRPFRSKQLQALHLDETHPDEISERQAEEIATAQDTEADAMFVFHLKVIGALVLVFMFFAYLWAFVLS